MLYSSLEGSDDAAVRQARLKGVTNAAKKANGTDIEALVRLAFGTKKLPAAASVSKMREFFSGADETFRSEEHTSELQSLMRISYAVFCLKKKKTTHNKS